MASTYPSRRVIGLCKAFIHDNYTVLSRFICSQPTSIGSLVLMEAVTGLLSVVASADSSIWLHGSPSAGGAFRFGPEAYTGQYSSSILQHIESLMGFLGMSLFPGHYSAIIARGAADGRSREHTWWSEVRPITMLEKVQYDTQVYLL